MSRLPFNLLLLRTLVLLLLWAGTIQLARAQVLGGAEYFWDADPGPGNGFALSAVDLAFDEILEEVASNAVAVPVQGVHTLNLRAVDTAGVWGPVYRTVLNVAALLPAVNIESIDMAEYFWDTDPGPGNGIQLLASDGNFGEVLEAAIGQGIGVPNPGAHRLAVRYQNMAGAWGPVYTTVVAVADTLPPVDLPLLQMAEYFWDTDPGAGNGTALVAADGLYDQVLEMALGNPVTYPGPGVHRLSVRFQDDAGQWGGLYHTIVSWEDTLPPPDSLGLVAGEAWWDVDPGPGNGIPLLATDGSWGEVLEWFGDSLSTLALAPGPHRLGVRLQDRPGAWGPVYTTVVWVDSSLVPLVAAVSGTTSLCVGDGLQGWLYDVTPQTGATFTWTVTGGTVVSGQGTPQVTVDWSGTGLHSVSVQGCNANGCGNVFTQQVVVDSVPLAAFSFASNQGTVTFTNSSQNAGAYLWDFGDGDTSSTFNPVHTYGQNGTYLVCLEALNGCGGTTECDTVTVLIVGLEEALALDWSIAPNPGTGMFRVGFTGEGWPDQGMLSVYAVDGRMVQQLHWADGNPEVQLLDLTGQTAGMYVVELRSGDLRSSQRLLLRR